jgi:DNA-directed RNA polymerase specialized sigma24 family protein
MSESVEAKSLLNDRHIRACAEVGDRSPGESAKFLGIKPRALRHRIQMARKRLAAAGLGDRFTPRAKPRLVA